MTRFNKQNNVVDVIGIGIGPFNLGLAALSEEVNEIDALFLKEVKPFIGTQVCSLKGRHCKSPFSGPCQHGRCEKQI